MTPSTSSVRRGHHQRGVLAGARLGLVGVDDEVLRLGVVLRDEGPLHAGREAGAAATAQAGVLDGGDDVVGRHRERLLERAVAAARLVGLQGPAALGVPVVGEDGGEGVDGHVAPPLLGCGRSAASCPRRRLLGDLVVGLVGGLGVLLGLGGGAGSLGAVGSRRRAASPSASARAPSSRARGRCRGRPAGRTGGRALVGEAVGEAGEHPLGLAPGADAGAAGGADLVAGAQVVDQLDGRSGVMLSMNSQLTIITGA